MKNGKGVIENKYEAYIWLSIARANGIEQAAKRLTVIEQRQTVVVAKPDIGESGRAGF